MNTALTIGSNGDVVLAPTYAPSAPAEVRVLALRKGKRGDARVYFRADAQKQIARPEGQISVEGAGAHHANNHNARLWRDEPLLVATGVTPLLTWQEGTARVDAIREHSETVYTERRASELAAFEAAVAEVAAVDVGAAEVLALHAAWKLPPIIAASKLKKCARRLRAGHPVTELIDARCWLPTSGLVGDDGKHLAALRYWTGHVEVFGPSSDPAARAACDAEFEACVALVEAVAPLVDEPLRPTFGPKGIARRHRVVMRHLRERSPLPRAA